MAKTDQSSTPPPSSPTPGPSVVDPRFQTLLTLISLLKGIRQKEKKTELEFMMVNQTFNLVPYRHCLYWETDSAGITLKTASGLVQIDPNGPYTLWLKGALAGFLKSKIPERPPEEDPAGGQGPSIVSVVPVTASDCSPEDAQDWRKWVPSYALIVAFRDRAGHVTDGLWIDREQPFSELESAILEDLADAYAHALIGFRDKDRKSSVRSATRGLLRMSKTKTRIGLFILAIVMCLPVRMSVTAPAEIVAREPYVVSVPFDGTVEKVEVIPGQVVHKGDVLVRMDSTMLRNKSDVTAREMETAMAAYSKTEREAFADKSKLAEISILKSQVEQKAAEKKFADELLSRAEIKAERDGIVIFSDANALRGKPVQTGEQIMLLADPGDSQLMIRVPVESMIDIDEAFPARFFLNVMPLGFNEAVYESIGYQATADPDGLLTYKIHARFDSERDNPRIGWTGTGKIYGQRTILAFNILRRPLVALRRKAGI